MPTVGEHGRGTNTRAKDGRRIVAVTMPDGTRLWRAIPKDPDGARQKRAAERALHELVARRDAELYPWDQTLAVWLRSWIDGLRTSERVKPRTLDHYAMIVEQHIIPALGHHRLERLTPSAIQAWLDADRGAPQTVHHHRAVLRRALNVAVRRRVIGANPATAVELPRIPEFVGNPLTIPEARALLALPGRWRALWRLALLSGLRQGELLGLTWDDLEFDAGRLTVTAQLQRRAGSWVRVAPKVARRVATIALDAATVEVLAEHKRQMTAERRPEWAYHGHVFVTASGNPPHGREILTAFHEACDAAGIDRRRFHDLRGSAATLMAEAGVPEDVRQARLGHATTRMSRHYAVVREARDREAVDRLAGALG
jgi:integrase